MIDTTPPPEYAEVEDILAGSGILMEAAEAHGLLCGLLCASGSPDQGAWKQQLLKGARDTFSVEGSERLGRLYEETLRQLNSPQLDFELLLPRDDQPLSQRTVAMGRWVEGFLFGLGSGGLGDGSQLSREGRELLADLGEITKVEFVGEEEETADEEEAFAEIVEYLRMGVLMLSEELNPLKTPPGVH